MLQGKLDLYIYDDSTQTAQTLTGTTTLSSNTKYYVMVTYNGSDYVLSLSTDGITYNQEATAVAQFVPGYSNYGYIIGSHSQYASTVYEVCLDGCYIKKNGQMIWAGMDAPGLHQKANIDLSNTPTNIDYVVESQLPTAQNNYTWYRKYKSGWVEQGGKGTGSGTQAVVLPVTMADTNYTVLITSILASVGADVRQRYVTSQTVASFTSSTVSLGDFYWEARGVAA